MTTAAAAVVCFGLGILAAWYETSVLIGPLDAGTLAGGFGIETAWICSCLSVVALWAAVVRAVPAIAGLSLASLLALVSLSGVPGISSGRPTRRTSRTGGSPTPTFGYARSNSTRREHLKKYDQP